MKDWLRFLLRQLPEGRLSLSPGQLTRCALLPAKDRALLLEALERTMAQIPGWDGEARRNYARFFRADPEVLSSLTGQLAALSVPEGTPLRVRRELARLGSLERHWPALYQLSGGRSRTEGRLLLLRTMLSLLYGALGGGGDWLPPSGRTAPPTPSSSAPCPRPASPWTPGWPRPSAWGESSNCSTVFPAGRCA